MATPVKTPFELIGADKKPLRGEIRTSGHGAGMPAVIVAHGFKGYKDWGFFPHIAGRLAGAGITAATFNFSGSGIGPDGKTFSEPERFAANTYSNQLRDVNQVIDRLLEGGLVPDLRPPTAIGLLGYSMGGATSIIAAATRPEIRSLVTWSAVSRLVRWDAATVATWRKQGHLDIKNARTGEVLPLSIGIIEDIEKRGESLNPIVAGGKIQVPWMIVHCEGDETVPVAEAEALAKASLRADLRKLAGGSHTFEAKEPWAGMTPALSEAFDLTIEHFARSLA